MKLKILKKFTDKNTGELYIPDMEIEVKDKRGEEILAHPLELAEKIEEKSIAAEMVMANVDVKPIKKTRGKKAE